MACRHWLWGEDKVARGWGETGLPPLWSRNAHAFSVIRRSCLVMRLLRGTGHPLLRGVQRVRSRMQWVPGLSRQTRHAMTPHALRDTLDRTHGLCHRQRSHHHGSQGLNFLIQALHTGQYRVHIAFSIRYHSTKSRPGPPSCKARSSAEEDSGNREGERPEQDNQGVPVLPQRAASQGEEQGVARLPFVLAEPPR